MVFDSPWFTAMRFHRVLSNCQKDYVYEIRFWLWRILGPHYGTLNGVANQKYSFAKSNAIATYTSSPVMILIHIHTLPQKSFRSVMAPGVAAVILMIFSEALSVSSRALTNAINFVLMSMALIVNFDNWQWVWKHLIIHIRLFKNILCCYTRLEHFVFFNFTSNSFKI